MMPLAAHKRAASMLAVRGAAVSAAKTPAIASADTSTEAAHTLADHALKLTQKPHEAHCKVMFSTAVRLA